MILTCHFLNFLIAFLNVISIFSCSYYINMWRKCEPCRFNWSCGCKVSLCIYSTDLCNTSLRVSLRLYLDWLEPFNIHWILVQQKLKHSLATEANCAHCKLKKMETVTGGYHGHIQPTKYNTHYNNKHYTELKILHITITIK